MKKYLITLAFISVLATACTYSNKSVDDSDQDSTLSGSLNNPDTTKNDTLSNTGVTVRADPSVDSTPKKEMIERLVYV